MKRVLAFILALSASSASAAELPSRSLAGLSPAEVDALLTKTAADSWWVRMETTLYSPAFAAPGTSFDHDIAHYRFVTGAKISAELESARVGGGSGVHLLHFPGEVPSPVSFDHVCRAHGDGTLLPVTPGMEWAVPSTGAPVARGGTGITDPQVQALVDLVDQDRYYNDIVTLANFGTRRTGTSGNINARNWIVSEFNGLGLTVTTPQFTAGAQSTRNVVGTLTGSMFPDEFLVVCAHFDSLPNSGSAPGAEDNASGTAAVLEIARIVAPFGSQRSIRFVTFSGEEQGVIGSTDFVSDLTPTERANFRGAINLDMIGYTGDAEHDVLLETSSFADSLQNELEAAAQDFTNLTVHNSFLLQGGDHEPFLAQGLPSVLAIEDDWATYPAYHQATDTPSMITRALGASITKMSLAALVRLANPAPISSGVKNWTELGE